NAQKTLPPLYPTRALCGIIHLSEKQAGRCGPADFVKEDVPMEFQLLAMNDSVGLLILVVGMAVAVALIALLESKMTASQPAASVPEERHAPAAAAKAAPAPAPRAPVVETGVPAEVVAAIAAAVACLEGGAATVRGIRRLPRPAGSRRGVWGEAGIAAVTTPF